MSLDEPPFMDKAMMKLGMFLLVSLGYNLSLFHAYYQFQHSEIRDNCFIRSIFFSIAFPPLLSVLFKMLELIEECPPEFKSFSIFKFHGWFGWNAIDRYLIQVILYRGFVLVVEVVIIISHFSPDHSENSPLACDFYFSLIYPAAAEVLVSIISLQVKNPKPNLRIDAIFLIILTSVLYLGEFSLPCLIICSVIIIIFEAMHIRNVLYAKIVMKNQKKGQEQCESYDCGMTIIDCDQIISTSASLTVKSTDFVAE
uniref:Serpentine receptor class gamma n=2 Tax=Caenorhabditis tropicalis TaxID=1561998 RepID=A0A1I7UYP9_9PELO